ADIKVTSGQTKGHGQVKWAKKKLLVSLFIELRDLNCIYNKMRLQGLNGSFYFPDVLTLTTGRNQSLLIQKVEAAIPIKKVKLLFEVTQGRFLVHNTFFNVAGGTA